MCSHVHVCPPFSHASSFLHCPSTPLQLTHRSHLLPGPSICLCFSPHDPTCIDLPLDKVGWRSWTHTRACTHTHTHTHTTHTHLFCHHTHSLQVISEAVRVLQLSQGDHFYRQQAWLLLQGHLTSMISSPPGEDVRAHFTNIRYCADTFVGPMD